MKHLTLALPLILSLATAVSAFDVNDTLICSYNDVIEYRDGKSFTAYNLIDDGKDTRIFVLKIHRDKIEIINSSNMSVIFTDLKVETQQPNFFFASNSNEFLRIGLNFDKKIVGYAGRVYDQLLVASPITCIRG